LLYIARETIRSILRIVKSYVQTKKSENIFSHRLQALFKEQKAEFYIVFAPVIPIVFFLTDYSGITFFVILLYGVPIILIIYLLTKLVFFIKLKLYKFSAVNDDHTFFKFLNQEKLPIIILLIILFHYSGLFFGILYGHSYQSDYFLYALEYLQNYNSEKKFTFSPNPKNPLYPGNCVLFVYCLNK